MEKVRLKMDRIKRDCGPVCETRPEKQEVIGKKFYNMIRKEFPCCSLFASKDFDAYTYFGKPPRQERTYEWGRKELGNSFFFYFFRSLSL